MGSLAATLYERGKHAEAEAMQREVLAALREVPHWADRGRFLGKYSWASIGASSD